MIIYINFLLLEMRSEEFFLGLSSHDCWRERYRVSERNPKTPIPQLKNDSVDM